MKDKIPPMTVGQQLAFWRGQRGLSQDSLSAAASVSVGTISRLENGQRVPTLRTMQRLAHALGVPVAALLPS